ncbi:TPA: hypothetical protein ACGUVV_005007 [Vibrio vulnificus]|uniref:hypothetical protein n=1 Tax=Vibrio vulnificus TaxID=672 RepID=UPI001A1D25A9|nr:hypothetical protein [Vibrio vulnificus]HAS6353737.1 hypothetical protein [Vibrio vulnificus]HAS6367584.1 hypothetical protein [Vibrio vulnificus]HDY7611445.1 hypothetical protein [Vibrio vulnificus]HDY7993285.1 hypothetical protein [Vibrio vulnificus]
MSVDNQLNEQRVLLICIAHLTAAINISKQMSEMSGDCQVQAGMISPLLILSSDLLSTSERYQAIGAELASFALAYSLRVAEIHCLGSDAFSELTKRLEGYIDEVMSSGHGVTPSRREQ